MQVQVQRLLADHCTSIFHLTQKHQLEERLITLKEELCRINPEALEEIERDCSLKNDSDDEQVRSKKARPVKVSSSKPIKKNERRKKAQPKLIYN